MTCACTSHFGLRMRISLLPTHAHLIWPSHTYLILFRACACHFLASACACLAHVDIILLFALTKRFQAADEVLQNLSERLRTF